MDHKTSQLMAVLRKEKAVYNDLLSVATQKKQSLVDHDLACLEVLCKKQADLLMQIKALEHERLVLSEDLGRKTITELIEQVPPDQQNSLRALQADFVTLVQDLDAVNQTNRKLVHIQLQINSLYLNRLTSQSVTVNTYNQRGSVKASPGRTGLINHQV